MKLLVATRNPGKLREIRQLLEGLGVDIVSAADVPGLPDVEEDQPSFAGNAIKKAVTLALAARTWTLAEDSGLEVVALGGAPGVHSARYAGEPSDPAANNAKLLREMDGRCDRRACFHCAVALSSPRGRVQVVEGRCDGVIAEAPDGTGGFGYDPIFMPAGYSETFARMDPAVKNAISHRGKALRLAVELWSDIFRAAPADWPARGMRL